jgi:FADH2 O2-dependent halogenase
MTKIECDIAIIGSGFGGTLLALIARKLGLSVVLLERGVHPRFVIGESSTPLADFRLAALADRFELGWLQAFSKYGTWKTTYPNIGCGLKLGFSFFRHVAGKDYAPNAVNDNALLVAASPDNERADTHWFRADFDAHLVERAKEAGVVYLDNTSMYSIQHERRWRLLGSRLYDSVQVDTEFVFDATGDGQILGKTLDLEPVAPSALRTRSRALYSHFTEVARWDDVLREQHGAAATASHPFPCDAAALHQIIDGGWMWVLRFDNGIISAGFSLDPDIHPIRRDEAPADEWRRLLLYYPSLGRQFANAEPVRPFFRTARLQRRLTQIAGADWALLPHAAGFLDAWLSPGIAQTLFAVEHLGRIMAEDWRTPHRESRLAKYGATVLRELEWMDEITGTCFACMDRFEVMTSVTMLYFVAAIHCEERERAGRAPSDAAFLLADDPAYREIAATICQAAPTVSSHTAKRFAAEIRRNLESYNRCGLLDEARRNCYPYLPNR